jgi:hypothetical protein
LFWKTQSSITDSIEKNLGISLPSLNLFKPSSVVEEKSSVNTTSQQSNNRREDIEIGGSDIRISIDNPIYSSTHDRSVSNDDQYPSTGDRSPL